MKKILKITIKSIIIVILVLILFVICFFIALYDSKDVTNYENISKNTPSELVVNNVLYEGTYNVKNTKEANVLFSEKELEALVYPVVMSLNQDGLPFEIVGVDIDVVNGEYYFETSVKIFNFFKSVIKAELLIENENEIFSITLKNLKLGAISATKISSFITKNIDINKFNNELKTKNIFVNVDLENFVISCSYDDVKQMLKTNIENEQGDLYTLLFDIFITNEQFMDLTFGNNDLIGAYVHLASAEFKEELEGELKYEYSFDTVAADVKHLLDQEIISYKDVNVVFNYLVRGYKALDEKEQREIDDIDFKSFLSDKKEYKGIIQKSNITLIDYINEIFKDKNMLQLLSVMQNGITISADFLTALLQSFNYMGTAYAFSNDENEVGYFVLEQLNFSCKNEFIDIHIVMNLNGLKLFFEASFDCKDQDSKGLIVNGVINDVNIGDYHLTNEQKKLLLSYLGELLNSLEWISIDGNTETICLDFSEAMLSVITKNELISSLIGNSINDRTKTYIEDDNIIIKFNIDKHIG